MFIEDSYAVFNVCKHLWTLNNHVINVCLGNRSKSALNGSEWHWLKIQTQQIKHISFQCILLCYHCVAHWEVIFPVIHCSPIHCVPWFPKLLSSLHNSDPCLSMVSLFLLQQMFKQICNSLWRNGAIIGHQASLRTHLGTIVLHNRAGFFHNAQS